MAGLPFTSLPAHVVGRGADSTGRTVDLQRLGNTLAGRNEDLIVEGGVARPADSRPAGHTGPWIEPAAPAAQSAAPAVNNTDPFVMLGQLRDTAMQQVTPLFDQQEAAFKSQIGKIKGDLFKQYTIEFEGLQGLGLDREQAQKRDQQLRTKYKMAYAKATSEIEPAMQELSLERQKAVARVDAEHAERSLRVQQVQALVEKGLIDPIAAKQEQLGILGYNVPLSALQPEQGQRPVQRLGELRPIYSDLLKRSAQYKDYPNGWRVFDEAAHDASPRGNPDKWYLTKATPEQAAEAEDIYQQLREVGDQIKELNKVVGRKPSLVETTASPIGDAVKASKLGETVMAVTRKHWPLGDGGRTRVVGGRTFKQVGPDQWVPVE